MVLKKLMLYKLQLKNLSIKVDFYSCLIEVLCKTQVTNTRYLNFDGVRQCNVPNSLGWVNH